MITLDISLVCIAAFSFQVIILPTRSPGAFSLFFFFLALHIFLCRRAECTPFLHAEYRETNASPPPPPAPALMAESQRDSSLKSNVDILLGKVSSDPFFFFVQNCQRLESFFRQILQVFSLCLFSFTVCFPYFSAWGFGRATETNGRTVLLKHVGSGYWLGLLANVCSERRPKSNEN